jgi:bacteriocin-like protein
MTKQKQMTEQELDQVSGGPHIRNYGVTRSFITYTEQGNSTQWSEICDVGASYKLKDVILTSLHKKGN